MQAISLSPRIAELDFDACDLMDGTPDAGAAFGAMLHRCVALRSLYLTNDGGEGAAAFIDALFGVGQENDDGAGEPRGSGAGTTSGSSNSNGSSRRGLTELTLDYFSLDEAAVAALGRALRSEAGSALEAFAMLYSHGSPPGLVDAVASEVADALLALGPAAQLRELKLVDREMHDKGAVSIARSARSLLLTRLKGCNSRCCCCVSRGTVVGGR